MNRFRAWIPMAVIAVMTTSCGREELAEEEPEVADTASAFQGLSPEEIRRSAEPMSPEMAESLGIIDTTIHIEPPASEDSLIPPQVRDSLR